MNNSAHRLALVLVAVIATLFVSVPSAQAQGGCSLATLKGTYGNVEQGTVILDLGFGIPVPFPAAVVGLITYDGAGNLAGSYTGSFGGFVMNGTVTGTYRVDPDCTYSDYVPAAYAHREGTITGDGMMQEIRTIFTDEWIVGGGTRKKVPVGGCSEAILKGPYSLFGQGVVYNPATSALVPVIHVGILTSNGKGNFYGSETVNLAGTPEANTFTGTYTVGRSCAVSAEISSSSGLKLHEMGVVVGDGVNQEVRLIISDQGWAFVDSLKRQ